MTDIVALETLVVTISEPIVVVADDSEIVDGDWWRGSSLRILAQATAENDAI